MGKIGCEIYVEDFCAWARRPPVRFGLARAMGSGAVGANRRNLISYPMWLPKSKPRVWLRYVSKWGRFFAFQADSNRGASGLWPGNDLRGPGRRKATLGAILTPSHNSSSAPRWAGKETMAGAAPAESEFTRPVHH